MLHRLITIGLALWIPAAAFASQGDRQFDAEPQGPVILTISGNVQDGGPDRIIKLDRAMLESLGTTKLKTSTAWTTGDSEFEGVLVRDLLEAVGAQGSTMVATALNDYVTTIPLQEMYKYPVLLAFKMDGEYLKIWDKGPLWIVYPRDQFPELRTSQVDRNWVWQLSELEIR